MATATLFHGFGASPGPDQDWVGDLFEALDSGTLTFQSSTEVRYVVTGGPVVVLTGTGFDAGFTAGTITGFEVYVDEAHRAGADESANISGISVALADVSSSGDPFTTLFLNGDTTDGYDVTGSNDDDPWVATGYGDTFDGGLKYDFIGYHEVTRGDIGATYIVVSGSGDGIDSGDLDDGVEVEIRDADDNVLATDTSLVNIEEIRGTENGDEFNAVRIDNNDWGGFQDINFVGRAGNDLFITHGGAQLVVRYNVEEDEHTGDAGAVDVNFETGLATDTYGDTDEFDFSDGGDVQVRGTTLGDTFTSGGGAEFSYAELHGMEGADDFTAGDEESNVHFVGGAGSDDFFGGNGLARLKVDYDNEKFDHNDFDGDWNQGEELGVLVNLSGATYSVSAATAPSDWDAFDGNDYLSMTAQDTFGDIDSFSGVNEVEISGTEAQDILIGADGSGNSFFARGGDDLLIGGNTFNFYQTGAGSNTVVGHDNFDMIDFGFQGIDHVEVDLTAGSGAGEVAHENVVNASIGSTSFSKVDLIVGTDGADTFTGDADTQNFDGDFFQVSGNEGNDAVSTTGGKLLMNYDQEKFAQDFDGTWGDDPGELGVLVNLSSSAVNFNTLLPGQIDYDGDLDTNDHPTLGSDTANDTFGDTDTLVGVTGIVGTEALDVLVADDTANTTLYGLGGSDFLFGGVGNDLLDGGAGADYVDAGDGDDDQVTGGAGNDTLDGGNGLNDQLEYRFEDGSQGVIVNLSATLQFGVAAGQAKDTFGNTDTLLNFENIVGTGSDDIIIGNAANSIILSGDQGNDYIDGGLGADAMGGYTGNDTYVVEDVGDFVSEEGDIPLGDAGGSDTVVSSISFNLVGSQVQAGSILESLVLIGNGITGTGNFVANTIISQGVGTIMRGLGGNDTYVVDDVADVVDETFAGSSGTDTVSSSINFTLGTNLEHLILTGTAANGTGNGGASTITGNGIANQINGAGGADTMRGLGGDDTYFVDDLNDVVDETFAGSSGADTVSSSVNFTIGGGVEALILTGAALTGTGNAGANTITGNGNANQINGAGGADLMRGLAGDDTYFVDNAGDVVDETFAGSGGTDTVSSSISYLLGAELENLVLTGGGGNGTGNAVANLITGNAGANVLDGQGGADVLDGQGGADMFLFSTAITGSSAFGKVTGNGNVDTIRNFEIGVDKIELSKSIYKNLKFKKDGTLDKDTFFSGKPAKMDEEDRILYNKKSGVASWDKDGSGKAKAIEFAVLDTSPDKLSAKDFLVVV